MHSTTLPAKSGLGQKHLVSELDEHPVGSQVLRQRGRISGQGTSGALFVGGTSGAGEEEAGSAGLEGAEVKVEGGAAVQRVQTVDVDVMTTVEMVVVTLVKVEEPEVLVRVTGHVVSVVITISVVMSVVTGGADVGAVGRTSVGVVTGGGGGAWELGGGGGGCSELGGGGGTSEVGGGGGGPVAIVVGGVSPHFGQKVAVEMIVVVEIVEVVWVSVKFPVVVVVVIGQVVRVVTTISVVTRSSVFVVTGVVAGVVSGLLSGVVSGVVAGVVSGVVWGVVCGVVCGVV